MAFPPLRSRRRRFRLEPLERRELLSAVAWTGAGGNLQWTTAANWSTGNVPGSGDDVTISAASGTVVFASGTVTVHSLTASDPLSITGGSLTVLANSTLSAGLAMTGGTLSASGSGVTLDVSSGPTSDAGGSLIALAGASIDMPNLTTISGTVGGTTFLEASGTGSQLSLAGLTAVTEDTTSIFSGLKVEALADGNVNLPALTQISGGYVLAQSDGSGSTLNLTDLNSFTGQWKLGQQFSTLQATDSGTVQGSALTSLSDVGLTLDGTGTLATSQLTAITGAPITVSGGTPNLSAVTNINGSSVLVSGGATVSLPGITSYLGNVGQQTTTIEATGTGSSLSLANVTKITGDATNNQSSVSVKALAGGSVNLSGLAKITGGGVPLESDGANSLLNVSALTSFSCTYTLGQTASGLQVTNSGTALDAALTSLNVAGLTLDGTGTVATSQYTSITHGFIVVSNGGVNFVTPNLSAVTNITGSNVTISGGANLTLADVDSYTSLAGEGTTLEATGTGSLLALPNLAAITEDATSGFSGVVIEAFSAGHVNMPGLASISGGTVQLIANGPGSLLNVAALASFQQTYVFSATNSVVQAIGGGTVQDSDLVTLNGAGIALDNTSSMATSQITTLDGSMMLSGGVNLSLPGITSFMGLAGETAVLQATGTGTTLALPNLTSIGEDTANFFSQVQIQSLAGGTVNMPALTTISGGPVELKSDGTSSLMNMPGLTTFTKVSGQGNSSSIQVTNSGTLVSPALGYYSGIVQNYDATATLSVPAGEDFEFNSVISAIPAGNVLVQGKLAVLGTATLTIKGSLTLNGTGLIATTPGATIQVAGNLLGNTQDTAQFTAPGALVFNGAGTAAAPQLLEAMSYDLGASALGFQGNFSYGTISLSGATRVKLVDQSQNSPVAPQVAGVQPQGTSPEAVYVGTLNVPAGTTLDLDGLHLYAQTSNIAGTIVNGTVTPVTVLHAPSVTNASTQENAQSTSGLVITPSALDATLVTNFQITNITGGSLFLSDGVTPVTSGAFITLAEGAAGLRFTPTANSGAAGSFDVQASTSGTAAGLGGPIVTATISVTVNPPVSSVDPLGYRTSNTSILVNWSGVPGTGGPITSYNILVSTDGGAFTPWLTATTETSATFAAQTGHTYSFTSQATDTAGNLEPARTTADTAVTIMALPWQNPGNRLNVLDLDPPTIVPADALAVIDYLNLHPGDSSLPATAPSGSDYLDVLGQSNVVPADALAVIDYLNFHPDVAVVTAATAPVELAAAVIAEPAVVSNIATSTAAQTAASMGAGLVGMNSAATAVVSIGPPPLNPAVMAVSSLSAALISNAELGTSSSTQPFLPSGAIPPLSELARLTTKQQVADSLFADPWWWEE